MKKALSLEQTVNRFLLCVAVWIFLQSIITPRLTALAPMLSALYVPVLQLTRLVSFPSSLGGLRAQCPHRTVLPADGL